jgi:DNA-binding transcriptional ArsR family regulator
MIEWTFKPEDVARIRFAFSPLWEAVSSLIVLRAPAAHALHTPWIRATLPKAVELDLSELFALVPVRGPTADFLDPPPTSPVSEFDAELKTVRRTPPERVVAELAEVPGLSQAVARRIRRDPAAAIARLADTLQAYWDLALAEHWPRIQALLEADVLWRARRLTLGGAAALFEDLHETITWHGSRLTAADRHDYSGTLSGAGLLLVPAVMPWPNVRKLIEPYQPTLVYPVRGILTLWETGTPPAPDALAALIGHTRAALLTILAQPASTTHLAHRLSLTPGAVSQHLTVLHDCGLVARSRAGRSVLYRRTRNGDVLVASDQDEPAHP